MATTRIDPRASRIPVDAIATSNLTLSGAQTVDTVALTPGKLCAALGQSDNKNAVYLVQSGAWVAVDTGIGTGLEVYATGGSANVNAVYGCDTTGAITWGTTTTAFTLKSSASGSAVNASTVTISGAPATPSSAKVNLGTESISAVQYLDVKNPGADLLSIGNLSGSGTSQAIKAFGCFTLANNETKDLTISGGLAGAAVISTGAILATIGIAASTYATTTGGQTYTNFSTTLTTANKLNVNASGGALRFENKTGGSINIVVDFTFFVTA
jgi:hypothetical protein